MTARKIAVVMYSRLRRDKLPERPVPDLTDFPLYYERSEGEVKQRTKLRRRHHAKIKS